MKEIQEKRIEKELFLLQETKFYDKVFKKVSKDEMFIELVYDNPDVNKTSDSISFILHMGPNYPFNSPQVFCKTGVIRIYNSLVILLSLMRGIYWRISWVRHGLLILS